MFSFSLLALISLVQWAVPDDSSNAYKAEALLYPVPLSDLIDRFDATWTVPREPVKRSYASDQLLYVWPGLFPNPVGVNGASISLIQPVLQWGHGGAAAGGGDFWSLATWFIYGDQSAEWKHSPLTNVSVNDVIATSIFYDFDSQCWTVDVKVNAVARSNFSVQAQFPSDASYNYAAVVLESYGCNDKRDCVMYPPEPVSFTGLRAYSKGKPVPKAVWSTGAGSNETVVCHSHIKMSSKHSLNMYFT